jgi:hypothetical protein
MPPTWLCCRFWLAAADPRPESSCCSCRFRPPPTMACCLVLHAWWSVGCWHGSSSRLLVRLCCLRICFLLASVLQPIISCCCPRRSAPLAASSFRETSPAPPLTDSPAFLLLRCCLRRLKPFLFGDWRLPTPLGLLLIPCFIYMYISFC